MAAAGKAPQHDTSPLGEPSAPGAGLRWRRVFPGEGSQLGVLRRWLESLLPERPERDDVACVANELGTNAVVHTASGHGGWFAVEITWHRAVVRVAVADCGAPGGPRMIDDPAAQPAPPRGPCGAAICGGQAGLGSRFAGLSAWFGRSTLQWWALAAGELVT